MATTIRIDPGTQKVHLEFSWADTTSGSSEGGQGGQVKTEETKAATPAKPAKEEPKQVEQKEYTMEEIKKHNTEDDCWVSSAPLASALSIRLLRLFILCYRSSSMARFSTLLPSSPTVSWRFARSPPALGAFRLADLLATQTDPGGKRAIVLYGGKDATEEFSMVHAPGVSAFLLSLARRCC